MAWSHRYSGRRLQAFPAGALYKAINTADSMIGHHTKALREFRLGGGEARRSGQFAGIAAIGRC